MPIYRNFFLKKLWISICVFLFSIASFSAAGAQRPSALEGRVMDPSGAVIPGATIRVTSPVSGTARTAKSDGEGRYKVEGLAPGLYTVTGHAAGFQTAKSDAAVPEGGRNVTLDLHLQIATDAQQVVVQGTGGAQLEVSPQSNATAVVISGKDIDALSNDPDELLSQLQALAGPAVGPDGGEIYIDGFTGGDMPPKSAIRSIKVNSNPFSVINDRLGYGRVDISTKAGANNFHGSASTEYNDARMNATSPFLGNSTPPAYHTWLSDADLSGPIDNKASFYFAMQKRNIDRANLVNTDILDANNNIVPYVTSVDNPRTYLNVNPRFDFQLSPKNALTLNYEYFKIMEDSDGVSTQSLPSTAYDYGRNHHDLEVMDDQTLSANLLNQTHLQVFYFHDLQNPLNTTPALDVLGAFNAGGSSGGSLQRYESHYDFQDYVTYVHARHMIQFGGEFLFLHRHENTNANFNGVFTFNTLSDYQQTQQDLASGQTMAQIEAAGYGPSQYNVTTGTLGATVNRIDGFAFVGDDWKISQGLTASYGLRFETENHIGDHADWAPRIGIAWAPGHRATPKTVVRAGAGFFYERFDDDQMIIAERLNGQNQVTYIDNCPTFYPSSPSQTTLAADPCALRTVYRIAPNLRSPYDLDGAVSVEHQVTGNATASLTYLYSRGEHSFLTNDINAPVFTPVGPPSGIRPLGDAAGNIYEYQSAGIYRQQQLIANLHLSAGQRLSIFGYYVLNYSKGDTNGVNNFPSNPWNLMEDYGRTALDLRNRAVMGGTASLPFAVRLSSMFIASSGQPFSIQLPQDVYGAGQHNARPAFATPSTPAADVAVTRYGSFNLATGPTDTPIAPNTGAGPADIMLNMRVSRTWGFGGEAGKAHGGEGTAAGPPQPRHVSGLGGRGLGGGGGFSLGGATQRRYALTVSASALNVFNTVNLAPPIATLGSPQFGESTSLASGPYSAQVGNPVANRLLNMSVSLSF